MCQAPAQGRGQAVGPGRHRHAHRTGVHDGNAGEVLGGAPGAASALQAEPELDGDLPVGHLAVVLVAAFFLHFEPVKVAQGLGGLCDAIADGRIDAFIRGSDNFRNAVSVIRQLRSS